MQPNPSQQTRSWPVRVASLLLLLEAVGLVVINLANLSRLEWDFLHLQTAAAISSVPDATVEAVSIALIFLPSAVLATLAAIGLFFIWRTGWLLAILTQGLTLLVCLALYFQQKPNIIYPIMLYTILMVLNLNSFEVRATVHDRNNHLHQLRDEPDADES